MNRILNLLHMRKINEIQFAKTLGVKPATISDWITGRSHPKIDTIIKICKEYNVTADWLLEITDEINNDNGEFNCYYTRRKHNWVSGCRWRVNYNKHWVYCPHCGKPIINLHRLENGCS